MLNVTAVFLPPAFVAGDSPLDANPAPSGVSPSSICSTLGRPPNNPCSMPAMMSLPIPANTVDGELFPNIRFVRSITFL